MTPRRLRIGIDVGGTFTDLFAFDERSGATFTHKVSSTPGDPHRAPLEGVRELLARLRASGRDVVFLGLGTTVATNAFLEGKGAPVGLITTRGFRDLLEIGRQTRPHLYDPFVRKPPPLVPRPLRREASERIAADGSVVTPLDERDVRSAAADLRGQGVGSIAICFLNAYANPMHEAQARAIVRGVCPAVDIVTSADVVPEFREFERFVSTVVNAALVPAMREYFREFAREVGALGIDVAPVVLSSSGGVLPPGLAAERPIDTLFSGPSGGVSGALAVCRAAGIEDFVTFDMGGTSTEVCLVRHGAPQMTHVRAINGYPVRTTSHDIHTIGAGGSSIAVVDGGGMLHVGPQSAGADPGPACYGTGGEVPTVTDANVVLGRLNQQHLLGGALAISVENARHAIAREVGARKGIAPCDAAAAIVALAEANMAQAIRVVSVERGLDPASYTLVAFGGAGPLHACAVARLVGMASVLVPPYPGVLCAMGVLAKDLQLNVSRTRIVDASLPGAFEILAVAYEELERTALERIAGQHVPPASVRFERSAAARYKGQNHEIDIAVASGELNAAVLQGVVDSFHAAHHELYGYAFEHNGVEIVTARLAAVVPVERPTASRNDALRDGGAPTGITRRTVSYGSDTGEWPVYDRADLRSGHTVDGPAIVEQMDTTIVIPPACHARVDDWLNLRITWT